MFTVVYKDDDGGLRTGTHSTQPGVCKFLAWYYTGRKTFQEANDKNWFHVFYIPDGTIAKMKVELRALSNEMVDSDLSLEYEEAP